MDATSRDDLLGPARTTTHSRATELTHRELDARDFAVRAFGGAVTRGGGSVTRVADSVALGTDSVALDADSFTLGVAAATRATGFSSAAVVGVGIGSGLSFEPTVGVVVGVA
jgi:hypothetical protein